MEDSISTFCKTLASFCNHLQSSCDALKQSVERRPIPLDSASSTFIQCLNRRVSSASSDLNLLESMSFGTVSFEELLGHCNEVYKKNQSDVPELEDRLKSLGYVPDTEINIDEDDEVSGLSTPFGIDSTPGSVMKMLQEDFLFDESLSLQNLGLSDVCLATLASEANGNISNPDISSRELMGLHEDKMGPYQPATKILETIEGDDAEEDLKSVAVSNSVISVTKDDYESLLSHMKSLAPWEDLLAAVEKMNLSLSKKDNMNGGNFFRQNEIASLGLGPKGRSYLLLLVRMNKLVVETVDGVISYRVL
ncbi:hypothetical protein L1049_007451 [Liquidambar formosana]|uniref:Spindle and kinetochore-associated protein 3 n=1 Tax=Liquidambar formosana TaxID=63359 RepID=A0AAP0S1F6_LIQFO